MTAEEFKRHQGTRTNAKMAVECCCSERMIDYMRSGEKPISARTQLIIEISAKLIRLFEG